MKDIRIEPATDFAFRPSSCVPFADREVCERVRKISGKDLEKHANPDFKIKVMLNPHPVVIGDLFTRVKESDDLDKKVTLILGNPESETYGPVAQLINMFRVNCRKLQIQTSYLVIVPFKSQRSSQLFAPSHRNT